MKNAKMFKESVKIDSTPQIIDYGSGVIENQVRDREVIASLCWACC